MIGAQAISTPKLARVVTAFALAPLVGTVVFLTPMVVSMVPVFLDRTPEMAYMRDVNLTILRIASLMTFTCAFSATMVFGLPAYFLLRKRISFSPAISAITGGLVALAAVLLLVLSDEGAQSDLEAIARLVAGVLGCGLIAGLVFWISAFWRDPNFSNPVSS